MPIVSDTLNSDFEPINKYSIPSDSVATSLNSYPISFNKSEEYACKPFSMSVEFIVS
ncbi:Uncharacterised protein [Yersinia enterocolitica]|nr:Uncharacterised protein [Yersinia enterocolitica]